MGGREQDPQWLRDATPAYGDGEAAYTRPVTPVPETAEVVERDDDDPRLQEEDL